MAMTGVKLDPSDPHYFDPTRDLAHCFPKVMLAVRERVLSGGPWGFHRQVFGPGEVTDAQMGEAIDIITAAVAACVDHPDSQIGAVLDHCGWFELQPKAQLPALAAIGMVMVSVFADAARRATFGQRGPADQMAHIRGLAGEAARAMAVPPWRRRLGRLARRTRRAWAILRGDEG